MILDQIADGLQTGTKITFDQVFSPEDIANALGGKLWTSKDGKVTNIYLKPRSGRLEKVWLWKKDDVTYYFSSEKGTYYPTLLAEAKAWYNWCSNRSSVKYGLALVEAYEKAETETETETESKSESEPQPTSEPQPETKIETAPEPETTSESDSTPSPVGGGSGESVLTPQVIAHIGTWKKIVSGQSVTHDELIQAGFVVYSLPKPKTRDIIKYTLNGLINNVGPFVIAGLGHDGRVYFDASVQEMEEIKRVFQVVETFTTAPAPNPEPEPSFFPDTADENIPLGMHEWVTDELESDPDFFNPDDLESGHSGLRVEVTPVKRKRGRPRKDALPLLPNLKVVDVATGKTVVYYPGGDIALSVPTSSPTGQIWQHLHSPFVEDTLPLPDVHPLVLQWLKDHAAAPAKVKVSTDKVPALPALQIPNTPRPFYRGKRFTTDDVPQYNVEQFWFHLHGFGEFTDTEWLSSLDAQCVMAAFRQRWYERLSRAMIHTLTNTLLLSRFSRFIQV
jgi:hypothetical protein